MESKRRFLTTVLAGILSCAMYAGLSWAIGLSGSVISEAGLAYDKNYTLDLQALNVTNVAATAIYSSGTFAAVTFKDGQVSTGSITIPASLTALSSAAAVNHLTVASTTNLKGASIALTGFVFTEGRDWTRKGTTSGTAANIAAAMAAAIPGLNISASGSVVYATAASYGSYYNSYKVRTSTPTALAWFGTYFAGGQDNAIITVNGTPFRVGKDFQAITSSAATATSLAAAINANTQLAYYLTATANSPTNGIVALQSDGVGTITNFTLASSTPNVTLSNSGLMYGGQNSAWALSGTNITIASHGLTTGLSVMYSSGGAAVAIGGLTNQTTYYTARIDANTLALASSKANAVAGTYITLATTNTPTAIHTFTLAPVTFVAATNTGFKWQVSNDNSSYSDLNVSSISWLGGGSVSGSGYWNFGPVGFRYLRAAATGPTTGGLVLNVTATGTNSY